MNTQSVAFITGGSRGIGKAIVTKFKNVGWKTVSCATTEKSARESDADLTFACDIANAQEVRQAIERVLTEFGRLDAVINNAGITEGNNDILAQTNEDEWLRMIDVNLHGTFYVCKYAYPHLPDHQGRIINISSVLGLVGAPDALAYCAAKHGVLGLTKALARKAAQRHITVNAICPGWVRSDMQKNRMQAIGISEDDLKHSVPLGRLIEPEEVADLAFYLVNSVGAAGITGQALTIDGGAII